MPRRPAQFLFAATTLAVAIALMLQLDAAAAETGGHFSEPWERVANVFAFFTVQSNLLVAVGCGALASAKAGDPEWLRGVRLAGLLGIVVTFLVYHAVLRDLFDLSGAALVADVLFHTVVPVLAVVGWLAFGPRGWVDRRAVYWAVGYVLTWATFTLIRGEVVGWYPYPFIDVGEHGYARVALNIAMIAAIFVGLGAAVMQVDKRLSPAPDVDVTPSSR